MFWLCICSTRNFFTSIRNGSKVRPVPLLYPRGPEAPPYTGSPLCGTKLSVFLFSITEQLPIITLHSKSINVDAFFKGVKEEACRCDSPVLSRQRKIPRRLDSGSSQHVFTSVEEYFRKDYYESIDCITGKLERRFSQENFILVQKIESMLLDSANGKDVSIPPQVNQIYEADIDMERLLLHLKILPDAIKSNSTHILNKLFLLLL